MNKKKQEGVALLEVMLTVFVISFGFLGFSILQLKSIRGTNGAYVGSVAVNKANEMADRIRINANSAINGDYEFTDDGSTLESEDCSSAVCTPSQLASYDLSVWSVSLRNELPSGSSQIARDNLTGDFLVNIFWDSQRQGVTGKGCDPNNQDDLTCFRVNVRL